MSGLATASVPAPSGPLSRDCLLQRLSLHIYVPTVEDVLIELSCHVRFRASSGTRNRILPHRSRILANGEPRKGWGRGSQPNAGEQTSRRDDLDCVPHYASPPRRACVRIGREPTRIRCSDAALSTAPEGQRSSKKPGSKRF